MPRRAIVVLLVAGCLRVDTDGDVTGGGGGSSGLGDGGVDAPPTSCDEPIALDEPGRYSASLPIAADGGTEAGCESARGAAFQLDLEQPAWVYLDTLDSPSGTAIALRGGSCDGELLSCSDTACGAAAGQILAPLDAGRYFVRVDGPAGEAVTLRFQTSVCAALPLEAGSSLGTIGGCAGGEAGSCGGGGTTFCAAGVAEAFWVLAGCGQEIQIDTCVGTFFDSVLYLRSGDCQGPEVACANANTCGDGDDEVLAGTLAPGMYFLAVDSNSWWDASYSLGVE